MADLEHPKSKKEPPFLYALGVGVLIGLIVSVTILLPITSIERLSLVFRVRLPAIFAILLVCITGALAGRAKSKKFIGVWLGAIIPLVVWGLLAIIGMLLFPGY